MDEEIYVNEPLSSRKIIEILDEHPHLKKIKCPQSFYLRTSSKYIKVLSRLGIEIEPVSKKGRPKKYLKSDTQLVQGMMKQGLDPKEISDKLNISLKSVYYLKKYPLKRGRKRKYSLERENKVKDLRRKGLSAKLISERLDIPLRTVYSLIKR